MVSAVVEKILAQRNVHSRCVRVFPVEVDSVKVVLVRECLELASKGQPLPRTGDERGEVPTACPSAEGKDCLGLDCRAGQPLLQLSSLEGRTGVGVGDKVGDLGERLSAADLKSGGSGDSNAVQG